MLKNTHYELILIKRCIKILIHSPRVIVIGLITISIATGFFLAGLYIEYTYLGIHVLDFNSLNALIHSNFWDHTLHFISILITLALTLFITTFLKFALAFILLEDLQGNKFGFSQAFSIACTRIQEIARLSLILLFGYPKYWFYIIDPVTQSTRVKDFLENSLEDEYDKYSHASGMLFLPLIIKNPWHVTHALHTSESILKKTFGKPVHYNFSYNRIRLFLSIIIFGICFMVFHFIGSLTVFPTLIISIYSTAIMFYIVGILKLAFDIIVYNYCNDIISSYFSEIELITMLT